MFRKKKLRIRTYGESVLREKAAKVGKVDDRIKKLVRVMIDTMRDADGLGLAAPQVGESLRLVVLELPESHRKRSGALTKGETVLLEKMPVVLVNPEIVPTTSEQVVGEEGCLSVPKVYAKVARPKKIMLNAETLSGDRLHLECGGFLAKAIQHEIDHLDGILFPDRLDPDDFAKIAPDLKKLQAAAKRRK